MRNYKKLSEESDITLWREYQRQRLVCPSTGEIIFIILMIVFYYSGYARWFFWFMFVTISLWVILKSFNGLPTYYAVLERELRRRGLKK